MTPVLACQTSGLDWYKAARGQFGVVPNFLTAGNFTRNCSGVHFRSSPKADLASIGDHRRRWALWFARPRKGTWSPGGRMEAEEGELRRTRLHAVQFHRCRKHRQACFAAKFVSTFNPQKTPSRGSGLTFRGEGLGKVRSGGVSALHTRQDAAGRCDGCRRRCQQPAAVDAQREIWSSHNALLRATKGWRYPLRLPSYRPHPRSRETTVLR